MADVEDQPVLGRIEDAVDGDRQFDDAETRAQMSAGARDRIDHLVSDFARKLGQVTILELAQVGGIFDLVEQRGFRLMCHGRELFLMVLALLIRLDCGKTSAFQEPQPHNSKGVHPSGKGTNSSSSPGTMSKRPVRHSSFAFSIRSLEEETKFHQMYRFEFSAAPPKSIR